MKIIDLNSEKLDNFLSKQDKSQFLQSWQWGDFQEDEGNKIFRLGIEKRDQLVAVATLVKKKIFARWFYFYCPRGPVIDYKIQDQEAIIEIEKFIFCEIEKISKKEKCIFVRFEPNMKLKMDHPSITRTLDIQPSKTVILDLIKTEDELLKEAHQKTRYNIRLAEKKGVLVRLAEKSEFKKFWELLELTGNRDDFRLHQEKHYQKMLELPMIKMYFSEYAGKVLAASIVAFFGDTATYVHGASSNKDRNLMAPYLLQWKVIQSTKQAGYKYYDFFGVDEQKWPGVTRFKKGFKSDVFEHVGTFDLIFDSLWYLWYGILRRARRWF